MFPGRSLSLPPRLLLRLRALIGAAIALCVAQSASASFLDTDFWCRTYGCAVVHDGQNYDIYDNWQFNSNSCCVPVGSPMRSYYNRVENPNVTGTLDSIIGTDPDGEQSMMLGITQNGSTIDSSVFDDGDGYLDAGDSLNAFTLSTATDIKLAGKGEAYSHSFFITSRSTRFSMRALATIANASGDFSSTIGLGDIKLTPSISGNGNDDGFRYGRRASTSNITIVSGIDDLGDLSGLPTQIIEFGRNQGIRRRNGGINEQTIRLDLLYTMPQYDLSMGIGSLDINVVFDFYREP